MLADFATSTECTATIHASGSFGFGGADLDQAVARRVSEEKPVGRYFLADASGYSRWSIRIVIANRDSSAVDFANWEREILVHPPSGDDRYKSD